VADVAATESFDLEVRLWRVYQDYFDKAEKKRRWSFRGDIPWEMCNGHLDPAVADVVESFCAVELFLPDYIAKIMPLVRSSRSRAWFHANWGYEESKHSLALGEWLLRSGCRSDEQMADLENKVGARAWNLPVDSPLGMLAYTMVQERSTWLNYRNLSRRVAEAGGDAALTRVLSLIAVDERAHYSFFRNCVKLYLQHDRPAMLEPLRQVMNHFAMPAIHDLADSRQRVARIIALSIFDEDIYYRDVYRPILEELGLGWSELRQRPPRRAQPSSAP
jgi:acyl-[acyl-carrier-protein] desaturase